MSSSIVKVDWRREDSVFQDNRYSREHTWSFDGGALIRASSSPDIVPIPLSNPTGVDPEEAFVVALSSCHMLWFLSLAAAKGFVVDRYTDSASGELSKQQDGKYVMKIVVFKPIVKFTGVVEPTDEQVEQLHEAAHHECFLANSVRSTIEVQGSWRFEPQASLSQHPHFASSNVTKDGDNA